MAKLFGAIGKLGIGLAVAGGVVNTALYNVDGGHRAVIFDRFAGVKDVVVGEGTHFLIPWVQKPIIFDIRSRPRSVPTVTGSKDLQNVNLTLRVLFRPQPSKLPNIFTTLGEDYDERVLPSIVNEVLKSVVAQYDAAELIMQREVVSQKVSENLTQRANQFGLLLDDISITHLTFGRDFTAAVEMKQVAQQDAEKARFYVEKVQAKNCEPGFLKFYGSVGYWLRNVHRFFTIGRDGQYVAEEQRKKAAVIRAEGDSAAAVLLSKAFGEAGEGLVELRKIEAAEDIAYQMSQSPNVVYLPQGQQTLLSLPQ